MLVGYVVSVAILDLIGVSTNGFFLYIIKCRAAPYNAIDVIQILKTVLIICCAVFSVWLEFVSCSLKPCTGVKYIFEDLFYHSSCLTFLCVAYIRRKVCECRGRASVLVTTKYATKTFLICLIPVFLFNAATLSLMSSSNPLPVNTSQVSDKPLLESESYIAFELSRIAILNLFPLLISLVLYVRILKVVLQTSRTMEENTGPRARDPTKLITQSVIILLIVTCSVWMAFVIAKTLSLFVYIDKKFFVYWKIVVTISHPFGEGLLQPSARKPVRRVQEWMHERSVRRVGPSISPSMTYDHDSMIDTRSLAEQLPTLIEERDSMIHRSSSKRDEDSEVLKNEKPIQMRRPSIRYTRPSMLVRNAAYIGLECRDTASVINIYRERKESVDKLKRGLKNIEELTTERSTARRLSTCLRLSSIDDYSEDEVYERYREMYSRRGSSKYSEKSSRKRSDVCLTPEYKGLPYASNSCFRERKESESSSGFNSPSRKRWKKLYTTARSARRFSKLNHQQSGRIEEEVSKQAVSTSSDHQVTEEPPRYEFERNTESHRKTETTTEDETCSRLSVTSLARKNLESMFSVPRRSLDSFLKKQTDEKPKSNVTKKRSISCVQNVWQKAREEQARKNSQRKMSVSFMNGAYDDEQARGNMVNTSRSLSYDAKEYYNYQKQREQREHFTRRSYGNNRYSRHSQEKIKVAHWLLEKDTTKEECIEKLIEMKDYF